MKYISDDLSLYTNKKLRSSEIVIRAWNLIEADLIYAMGIADKLMISIYIENDSVILSCSSNYNVIRTVRKTFNINHVLTIMTDLSVNATISLNLSSKNNINYKKCSFYYEKNNRQDDGSIEIECDASYNINSYESFKIEIMSAITKELQFLIHRNILNSDISTCDIANIDAEFESLSIFANIKNLTIKSSIKKRLENKYELAKKINKLLDRISYSE